MLEIYYFASYIQLYVCCLIGPVFNLIEIFGMALMFHGL